MGNVLRDEALVGADQAARADVAVKNSDMIALAQQRFDDSHQGALAEIVRIGLECHAQETDTLFPRTHDQLKTELYLDRIALQNGIEYRTVEVQPLCLVSQRTQILWQTGAAKGKARLEVGSG